MFFSIANRSYMCSTLILGAITSSNSFELFVNCLEYAINESMSPDNKSVQYDQWSDDKKSYYQTLDDYQFSSYSFVVCTTVHYQEDARKHLEQLGFKSTEEVFNRKNSTKPCLHYVEVPILLKNLSAFKKEQEAEKKAKKILAASKKEAA